MDRQRTEMCNKELLVVSFGTTSAESRELNIGAVEDAIEAAVGDEYNVRRCFTSQMIINIIKKREGVETDTVAEAVDRAERNGIRELVVQPTHLMNGLEYDKLKRILEDRRASFERVSLGDPLLTSEEDLKRVAKALVKASEGYDDGRTAFVFMGHGTEAASNDVYNKMQRVLDSMGRKNFYIGTVEAKPSLEDVIATVKGGSCSRVVLRPLMLVAGNHAINDMSSPDDPDSWYSRFSAEGYRTICVIEGLGQLPDIRDIYVDHASRAITFEN